MEDESNLSNIEEDSASVNKQLMKNRTEFVIGAGLGMSPFLILISSIAFGILGGILSETLSTVFCGSILFLILGIIVSFVSGRKTLAKGLFTGFFSAIMLIVAFFALIEVGVILPT